MDSTQIPSEALEYIKNKKLKVAFSYKDVWNEEHVGRQRMQCERLSRITALTSFLCRKLGENWEKEAK